MKWKFTLSFVGHYSVRLLEPKFNYLMFKVRNDTNAAKSPQKFENVRLFGKKDLKFDSTTRSFLAPS